MDTGTMVSIKPLSPDAFPVICVCPYPQLKHWTDQQIEDLGLNEVQFWKMIFSKAEKPLTSQEVQNLYEEGTFFTADTIHDVIVEFMENSGPKRESILDSGRGEPLSPFIGKEYYGQKSDNCLFLF